MDVPSVETELSRVVTVEIIDFFILAGVTNFVVFVHTSESVPVARIATLWSTIFVPS